MVPTGKESGKGKHCLSHLVGVEPEYREHRSTWKEDRVTRVLDHHQMMKMTLLVIAVIVAVFLPLFLSSLPLFCLITCKSWWKAEETQLVWILHSTLNFQSQTQDQSDIHWWKKGESKGFLSGLPSGHRSYVCVVSGGTLSGRSVRTFSASSPGIHEGCYPIPGNHLWREGF